MATFTISLPEDLKKKLDLHPEIHWAEHLKHQLQKRVQELQRFEELKNKGKI